MMKNMLCRLTVLVAAGLLGGCASGISTSPKWDASFGRSLTRLTEMQTLHPHAVAVSVESSIDGEAAVSAQDNYVKSFVAPSQPSGSSIGSN